MLIYSGNEIDLTRNKSSMLALSLALAPITDIRDIRVRPGMFYRNCEFHYEKTPSLGLYELTSSYHCYNGDCNKTGTIFKYLMEIKGMSYQDSIATLAKAFNLKINKKADERMDIVDKVLEILESKQYKKLIEISNAKLLAKENFEMMNKPKKLELLSKFEIEEEELHSFLI